MDKIFRHSHGVDEVQFAGLRIKSLLFADDVVLLALSDHDLQPFLYWFAADCEKAGESAPPNLRPI